MRTALGRARAGDADAGGYAGLEQEGSVAVVDG
jgi:hypothetical protein